MSAQRATQLIDAGVWLQLSGDTEGARRLFEQAAKLDPANARAQQMLASISAENDQQALEAAKAAAAISVTPSNPFRPPPVESTPGLMDVDWAGAMGGEAPVAPVAAAPAPVAAVSAPRKTPSVMDFFFETPGVAPGGTERAAPSSAAGDEASMWRALAEPMPPLPSYPESGDPSVPEAWEVAFSVGQESAPGSASHPSGSFMADPVSSASTRAPSTVTPRAATPPSSDPAGSGFGSERVDVVPKVRPVTFASGATSAWDSQSNPGVQVQDVKPGLGVAMDLVEPATEPGSDAVCTEHDREVEALLQGARDLLDLDDHSGAMELITKAHQLAPTNAAVLALRQRSENTLQAMFESRLGHMSARPHVVLKDDEIIWLNLDHRAGFVLAQIDGTVSFEDLFEVCGMSRLDTARILAQLMDEGVISA